MVPGLVKHGEEILMVHFSLTNRINRQHRRGWPVDEASGRSVANRSSPCGKYMCCVTPALFAEMSVDSVPVTEVAQFLQ